MPVPLQVTPARAMRRPGLVSFLAVLHFLAAALSLFGVLALFQSGQRNVEDWAIAAVLAILAVSSAACGWGLWNLTPWGRVLQIVFSIVGLVALPIGTIASILLLKYLFKPGTKILFSGRSPNHLAPEEVSEVWEVTGGGKSGAVAIIVVVLVGVAVMGVIAEMAIPKFLNSVQRDKQKRTMKDMQTIGSFLERYKTDKGYYPEVRTMEELAGVFPESETLARDAWKHPYRFSSALEGWVLVSAGRDGEFELDDPKGYLNGTTKNFNSDIVLTDAGFIQVPDGLQN